MLTHLRIKNYALIKDLDIDFREHLNIITGETGAGKSILLGALGLILGNRADTSVLFDSDRKCIVEGTFNINNYQLQPFFEREELDYETQTLIRREINSKGKSRAFINDTPVTLSTLKELGQQLVDIHSQHQTQQLNDPNFQQEVVDGYAKQSEALQEYQQQYRQWRKLVSQMEKLREQEREATRELDYYKFQLNELEQLALQPGEQSTLEEELELLSHAEAIQEALDQTQHLLYESEGSAFSILSEAEGGMKDVSRVSGSLKALCERLNSLSIEVKDIYEEARNARDEVEVDEARLSEVNQRLSQINLLLKKHHLNNSDELLQYLDKVREKVQGVESVTEELAQAEQQAKAREKELQKLAGKLSQARQKAAPPVADKVAGLLKGMGMPQARLQVEVKQMSELASTGQDRITILFSANPGAPLAPVAQAASGGELSRIMLGLKYVLAEAYFLPTLIFDEIDTGISGETAKQVGQLIKSMAQKHQVISITHLPQMAAQGDHHYVVYKELAETTTSTHLRELASEERLLEIATMIAGKTPSQVAIDSARELMKQ